MRPILWEQCPKPEWVSVLGYLIHRRIDSEHIAGFLQSIFHQREIMDPFLRYGASRYVHHCEYGGMADSSNIQSKPRFVWPRSLRRKLPRWSVTAA
jgi:hypothetical protein